MTQNTEQNVRTREYGEAMALEIRRALGLSSHDLPELARYARKCFEAGAADQRRKDEEGQEPVAWQWLDAKKGWLPIIHDDPAMHVKEMEEMGIVCRPVYLGPANVAGIDIDAVIQAVSELPDRTSPEGHPDLLTVTADELRLILSSAQPANVDALEARIAELEAGIARIEKQANEYPGEDAGALGWISSECDALTREGGADV
ncbi:hypothetical protein [Gluconobacter japonicus]|uniref:hypothetical protein n=1 Tax=Gluconobacter japonicus TaxID=376620 RepID=UPI000781FA0D|nr:hypothetical protein [Gluconobacter japonicus]KXV20611.1 hypothetical protein AD935_11015 [Gluconobacter japonicus]